MYEPNPNENCAICGVEAAKHDAEQEPEFPDSERPHDFHTWCRRCCGAESIHGLDAACFCGGCDREMSRVGSGGGTGSPS